MELALQCAVAAAVVLLGIVGAYCAKRFVGFIRQFFILSRLPFPRNEPLVLGSALEMIQPKRMHLALREWAEELGGIYTFRITCFHVSWFWTSCQVVAAPSVTSCCTAAFTRQP